MAENELVTPVLPVQIPSNVTPLPKRLTPAEVTVAIETLQERVARLDEAAGAARGDHRVMTTEASREEIDAKLALSEARTETKFVELKGSIDLLTTHLEARQASILDALAARDALSATRSEEAQKRTELLMHGLVEQYRSVKTNIWTSFALGVAILAIVASLIAGMASYGAATFYNGTVIGDVVDKVITMRGHPTASPDTPAK